MKLLGIKNKYLHFVKINQTLNKDVAKILKIIPSRVNLMC